MKVLCLNTNDSVWNHWKKVVEPTYGLVRTFSFDESIELLSKEETSFEYCFVYLEDALFSQRVEEVVSLRLRFGKIKIIAFPNQRSQTAALRMLSNGINGQCNPFIGREQLSLVLSVVDSGEIWGGKDFIRQLIMQTSTVSDSPRSDPLQEFDELSPRERNVANLIAKGLSNKQIAREMDITERTVKAHLTTIFKKLDVQDRLALALLVQRGVTVVH